MTVTRLHPSFAVLQVFAVLLFAPSAFADEPVQLVLEDNRFVPSQLTVPAGQRVQIEITNRDATPAEFESKDLRVEKMVPGGATVRIGVGPLEPGTYTFFDEFHEDTAAGTLIAAEAPGG